ncbi:MAG: glycosyltransferase family 2 protein [Deltaproteobacteria bacterium]|nr:glycosyltransferase family 2 protein [Deltaproteobacteria bacterium]
MHHPGPQKESARSDLSVILPIYNERENLSPLLAEIDEALSGAGLNYEIIAVDDGSTDGSTAVLKQLCEKNPRVRVVLFRRNAGQTAAFDAGFRYATGRLVVTMDSDRQNDPHDIPRMIEMLQEGHYDLISGWRKKRKDGAVLRRLPSLIANWVIRRVTKTKIHDLGCSLKVYRREITDELRLYGEMHRFIAPLAEGIGAKVGEFVVNHRAREAGTSKYGIARTFKVVLDLITVWFLRSYQTKPIYVFGGAGASMLGVGFLLSLYTVWEKLTLDIYVHRNPLFSVAIMLTLIGFQFLGMGIISEIIVRTYFESQDKRIYSVAELIGFEAQPLGGSMAKTKTG